MKNVCLALIYMLLFIKGYTQKKWDGGGGDGLWNTANNWFPDGVPLAGDDIMLDQSLLLSNYTVLLPTGPVSVSVSSIQMLPFAGNSIVLHLPSGNTAIPGLQVTGTGESLVIGNGATLRNASGATSGDVIQLTGLLRINNGGRYLHNTPRGNAALIDKLSVAAGTEWGIFEFDVPGTAGYTVSLTGNTFGSLVFSAEASGGTKSYSGSGTSTLQINGNWSVQAGASLTSTLSANILIKGDLTINGNLNLHPSTTGTTGRSIFFTGSQTQIKGTGNLSLNANFRNLEIFTGSSCTLSRNINLPQASHTFLLNSGALLHTGIFYIDGNGRFTMDTDATLGIGSSNGISNSGNTGNIRTLIRDFNEGSNYLYEGNGNQVSGSGLPTKVNGLGTNKPTGELQLINNVSVTGELSLISGKVITTPEFGLTFSGSSVISPVNQYGQTNTGWEKSFIDGPIQWETNLPGSQVIPIGKGDVFAPVTLEKESPGYSGYRAEYFPVPYAILNPIAKPPLDHISQLEHWTIRLDPASVQPAARVGFSWRPMSGVGKSASERNDLRITQWEDRGNGLQWEENGDNPLIENNGDFGLIKSNFVTSSFSTFTLASHSAFNILPIRGIRLSSFLQNAAILLSWALEGYDDWSHFNIEKSMDGQNFQTIGKIHYRKDQDTLTGLYLDDQPGQGWNYYRIRVVTATDSSWISPVTMQFLTIQSGISLYPNPANHQITLYFPEASSGFECLIVNTIGAKVCRAFILQGKHNSIPISDLPKGRYGLIIIHQNKRIVIPFIKE